MKTPKVIVLCGGVSPERDISIISGNAVYNAIKNTYDAQLIQLESNELPSFINPSEHVVMPIMHGFFGEDGQIQELMEQRGVEFFGSRSLSSKLCMDKIATKELVSELGVVAMPHVVFRDPMDLNIEEAINKVGEDCFLKPADSGSSLNMFHIKSKEQLIEQLKHLEKGYWMLEKRAMGREVTIGIVGEVAQLPIEILNQNTFYDFREKYTKGITSYNIPAKLPEYAIYEIQQQALAIFQACNCRDLARLDFIVNENNEPVFIEINTMPGFSENSLVPKASIYEGVTFEDLCIYLVDMLMKRYNKLSINV